jgi:predicted DNA-binding WGR domain protein
MPRTTPSPARRFEFVGSTSAKFWSIRLDGKDVIVCFGRIGSAGQNQTKTFPSEAKADEHAAKLIAEKLAKGYREVGPASAA